MITNSYVEEPLQPKIKGPLLDNCLILILTPKVGSHVNTVCSFCCALSKSVEILRREAIIKKLSMVKQCVQ